MQVPTFTCDPGEVVAVVGRVGAGKSAMLDALLGTMPNESGDVKVGGKLAYVPQVRIRDGIFLFCFLLGTMPNESGDVTVGGKLAYVPQVRVRCGKFCFCSTWRRVERERTRRRCACMACICLQPSSIPALDHWLCQHTVERPYL